MPRLPRSSPPPGVARRSTPAARPAAPLRPPGRPVRDDPAAGSSTPATGSAPSRPEQHRLGRNGCSAGHRRRDRQRRRPSQTSSAGPSSGATGGGGGTAGPAPGPGRPAPAAADRTGVTDTKIRVGIHAPITGAAPFPQNAFDKGKDVYWKFLAEKGGHLRPQRRDRLPGRPVQPVAGRAGVPGDGGAGEGLRPHRGGRLRADHRLRPLRQQQGRALPLGRRQRGRADRAADLLRHLADLRPAAPGARLDTSPTS